MLKKAENYDWEDHAGVVLISWTQLLKTYPRVCCWRRALGVGFWLGKKTASDHDLELITPSTLPHNTYTDKTQPAHTHTHIKHQGNLQDPAADTSGHTSLPPDGYPPSLDRQMWTICCKWLRTKQCKDVSFHFTLSSGDRMACLLPWTGTWVQSVVWDSSKVHPTKVIFQTSDRKFMLHCRLFSVSLAMAVAMWHSQCRGLRNTLSLSSLKWWKVIEESEVSPLEGDI